MKNLDAAAVIDTVNEVFCSLGGPNCGGTLARVIVTSTKPSYEITAVLLSCS